MRFRRLLRQVISLIMLAGLGCRNPEIVPVSPDTYILFREDHAGIFGSFSSLKAGVIRDANLFAEKKGKVAIPISTREKPIGNGPAQWASFEYQFRVVDKNDPEVRRTSIVPRPDLVIEKSEKLNIDVVTKDKTEKPKDLYTELSKLDELRKKGIITDAEFETQKKKILQGN